MGLNYWLYRAKYKYGKSLNLTAPVDLSIELSSSCDLACVFCYHADPTKLPFKRGLMNFDVAKKAIFEGAEIGVHSFKPNFRGESTLHPNFEDVTKLAKSLAKGSTYLERITNSNFNFNKNRDSILRGLCSQTKVKISLDSMIKSVLEKQRVKSNYEVIIKNIDDFYNHPNRKDSEIVIQAVRTQLNQYEDLTTSVKKRWPEATCRINDMVSGRVEKNLDGIELKKRDASNRQPCSQAFVRMIVRWDGKVQSCCPSIKDEITLGDITKTHLQDIWLGEENRNLQLDLKSGKAFDKSPCKSCPSFESYKPWKAKWEA